MKYLKKAFLYLTKHETIAVAVSTVIVAIMGFLFKYVIYIKEHLYLTYWNIEDIYINIDDNVLYNFIWSIVFEFFIYSTILLFDNVSDTYSSYYMQIKKEYYINKYYRKEMRKFEKMIKKHNKKLNKLKKFNVDLDSCENLKIELLELSKKASECNNNIENVFDLLKRIKKFNNKYLFLHVFLILIIDTFIFIPIMLPAAKTIIDILLSLLFSLFLIIFTLAVTIIIKILSKNKQAKKEVKNKINSKTENTDSNKIINSSNNDSYYNDYLFVKLHNNGLIKTIKSLDFVKICNMCILVSFAIIIASGFYGHFEASKKNSFEVFNNNNINYAIVYNNKEKVIAKKIKIDDKQCVIDINKQIVMPIENIETQCYKFEKVKLEESK